MKNTTISLGLIGFLAVAAIATSAEVANQNAPVKEGGTFSGKFFKAEEVTSSGSAMGVSYQAIAGSLVVHPENWDESASNGGANNPAKKDDASSPEASMFFVYYAKKGADPSRRPITFLFNGGPGSSTVWLHMGAFGPKRVVTADDSHTPGAPYTLIENNESLIDVSDLVFIDAPGTGFSRVAGKDKEKEFYGIDPDAQAFATFIQQFLTKYARWNSPKYVFGESYGTPRAAVLVNDLETNHSVDFNGVIMLSQILNFDLGPDGPGANPSVDLPYEIALPTYAASAWYHHKIANPPKELSPYLQSVERFAMTDYALALQAGAGLPQARRLQIAKKLHDITALPLSYILKANLRIDGGEFEQTLLDNSGATAGRLDTRFSGPDVDPLSERAGYDPQSSSISSAYVTAFNHYVRTELHYGDGRNFVPISNVGKYWEAKHVQPGNAQPVLGTPNVMPDLANAMIQNPNMKILVNGGYYDLATPYYEGWFEMHHLPVPASLQSNIEYHYYPSGHMVYAHPDSLKELHDAVAGFVRKTSHVT